MQSPIVHQSFSTTVSVLSIEQCRLTHRHVLAKMQNLQCFIQYPQLYGDIHNQCITFGYQNFIAYILTKQVARSTTQFL